MSVHSIGSFDLQDRTKLSTPQDGTQIQHTKRQIFVPLSDLDGELLAYSRANADQISLKLRITDLRAGIDPDWDQVEQNFADLLEQFDLAELYELSLHTVGDPIDYVRQLVNGATSQTSRILGLVSYTRSDAEANAMILNVTINFKTSQN